MSSRSLVFILSAVLALSACDRAAPRVPRRAPAPTPAALDALPAASTVSGPTRERAGPIHWDQDKGAFTFNGQPLRAEKLWTFDGATDGFSIVHGELTPADGSGLVVQIAARDAVLRTPRGLNVEGATRSLLIVRLTRRVAVKHWDPTVYYSTRAHAETQAYFAKPALGADPQAGEVVTMVFNMRGLAAGGDDWKTSAIDQVRLDVDEGPGGAFVIHQVAIAQDPGGVFPPSPPPAKAQPKASAQAGSEYSKTK